MGNQSSSNSKNSNPFNDDRTSNIFNDHINSNNLSNNSNNSNIDIQQIIDNTDPNLVIDKSLYYDPRSEPKVEDPAPEACDYKDDEEINTSNLTTNTEKITSQDRQEALKLSLKLKKKTIQSSSFNAQTFPMLVSLATENIKETKKAGLDLVCVIDHSGSMMGYKIELVKKSFNLLLNFLGENDRLSIVIFDHRASRLIPLMRMTEENKKIVLEKLKDVHGRGNTDIDLGMRHAFQILKQRRYQNAVTGIFLLSDGLDGGAQEKVKASLAQSQVSEDITINTFGFGTDHDPQLMSDIADLRDGNFYFVEKLDTVDEAFVDCLGGLLSIVGQNVIIKISPEKSDILPDVKIPKAYGEASMWTKEGDSYITKLGYIITGRQKDFVLELEIPVNKKELQDHEKSFKVASAEVTLTTLDGEIITKAADLTITLLNETEEVPEEEETDKDVMMNFYRVKGALVLSDAKKLADETKYDEAKKLLQSFKEELEGSFLKDEEFIKNLVKDIEKAIEDVRPTVYALYGKHNMMENTRAQMHQKVNLKSANCYQNEMQLDMLNQVRIMKNKK